MRRLIAALAATVIMVGFALFRWAAPDGGGSPCPENPLEGVWGPARLVVLGECVKAAGMAHNIHRATDGDITFDLAVDEGYEKLLGEGATLHVEIVPVHQGFVPIPKEGEHVCVTGTWVIDKGHGEKTEIHPATAIEDC